MQLGICHYVCLARHLVRKDDVLQKLANFRLFGRHGQLAEIHAALQWDICGLELRKGRPQR